MYTIYLYAAHGSIKIIIIMLAFALHPFVPAWEQMCTAPPNVSDSSRLTANTAASAP